MGVITAEELDAVVGTRKQCKHFVRSGQGHKSRVHAKHVVAGVGELAKELAHSGGALA